MPDPVHSARVQIGRQVAHWRLAAQRLNLDELAAPQAWARLETYLGVSLRRHLGEIIAQLRAEADSLQAAFNAARSATALIDVRRRLLRFRQQYVRSETTLDFFADAINTRTDAKTGALLKACDSLAHRAMSQLLDPLKKPTPVVLTYLDKGLGASILKAGMRLWDGTNPSPVAAIKITRHNLYRPTALIHEVGHQTAHITGWNGELAGVLRRGLAEAPGGLDNLWASWSSEIAADAFAFVHTGYASVAGLHDVVAGEDSQVFHVAPGDPHPAGYIRVLLGVEMCRAHYGAGPWDDMAEAWQAIYFAERSESAGREELLTSRRLLPRIVELVLATPMRAFDGRPLTAIIDPARVSPTALVRMETTLGPALFTSMHWVWAEALRLLALSGYRAATEPGRAAEAARQYETWMVRLAGAEAAA